MAATSNRLQALEDAVQSLAFVHDPYGKLTKDGKNTYAYDARGRLKRAVTAAGSFTYRVNAQGERVRKTNTKTQESTFYHYDEALHLLAESDASGRVTREYVWLGDTPIALVDQTGTIYAIHSDHINTPRLITDARAVWENSPLGEPFGRDRPNADPQATGQVFTFNLRFPGQYFDPETGAHYNLFRDQYFPELGRYGQSDPIGLDGGINTYGYVGGNPLRFVDPWGLQRSIRKKRRPVSPSINNPGFDDSLPEGANGILCAISAFTGTGRGCPLSDPKLYTCLIKECYPKNCASYEVDYRLKVSHLEDRDTLCECTQTGLNPNYRGGPPPGL